MLCIAIALLVPLIVFGGCLHFGFLIWDDVALVTANPFLENAAWGNLKVLWTGASGDAFKMYMPVTFTVWHFDTLIGRWWDGLFNQFNPVIFHATNLIVHTTNVLLVFLVLRLCVGADVPALCGALLFAVHPLVCETVSWVSELKGLLATGFCLAALWQYLLALGVAPGASLRETAGETHFHRWRYGLAMFLLVVASLSKPSAVVLPLVALIVDWQWIGRPFWTAIRYALPLFAIAAIPALLIQQLQTPEAMPFVTPLADRPLVVGDALTFYVSKLFWPANLAAVYGRTPQRVLAEPITRWIWLVPLGLTMLSLWRPIRRPALGAWLVFVAALLPVLGMIPFLYQLISTVADRYVYLALLGPAYAVAWTFARYPAAAPRWAWAIALALLSWTSVGQAATWKNDEAWAAQVLRVNPSAALAYSNLGVLYIAQKRYAEALEQCQAAVAAAPEEYLPLLNEGRALVGLGRGEEALPLFEQADRLSPDNPKVRVFWGSALVSLERFSEALPMLEAAGKQNPLDFHAPNEMAYALFRLERFEEASSYFARAARLHFANADMHFFWGRSLLSLNRPEMAMARWRDALLVDPDHAGAHFFLGQLLRQQGEEAEAVFHLKEAQKHTPSDATEAAPLRRALGEEPPQ